MPLQAASPASGGLLVNPPAGAIGARHVVLTGTRRSYHVPAFEGPPSIKTVVWGAATWATPDGRHVVHEGACLLLNERQRYTLEIESARPVTTFCLFFQRGYIEELHRSLAASDDHLLDEPELPVLAGPEFRERLEPLDGPLASGLADLRELAARPDAPAGAADDAVRRVALALIAIHRPVARLSERLPAARASTRAELARRLLRGRDFLLSSIERRVSVADAARAAGLSPSHFHLGFARAFGQTPHRFLTDRRLARASYLLATTDRSVTEIALDCGFESVPSFTALVRRRLGAPPGRLRRPVAGNRRNR